MPVTGVLNGIASQIDSLSTEAFGVLFTNDHAVNLTRAQSVTGITIGGEQPARTARYIAFLIDGQWGRLTSSGSFSPFISSYQSTYQDISRWGNTPAELVALTSVPALAGKTFGVAFALMSEDPELYGVPSCSISFQCKNNTQVLTATEFSPIFELGQNAQIITLSTETEAASGGNVAVSARITKPDGSVSDWGPMDSFAGQRANAVEFRGIYSATKAGVSTAKINSASILYSDGQAIMNGSSSGELISLTQDWHLPIRQCRLTIQHAPLEHSDIMGYVALRPSPVSVKREQLGTGNGAKKVFQLAHISGLKYDTLKLYFDNIQVFTNYELNCEAGRVTCEAPEGVLVSCDYDYGWDNEVWEPMTLESRIDINDIEQSEFRYVKPADDGLKRSVCALKIVMNVQTGTITGEKLGTSTGRRQSFKLSRHIRDGKITVYGNGIALDKKYWTTLEDSQYIAVTAPSGRTLTANYDWVSETPSVFQFYATYAE